MTRLRFNLKPVIVTSLVAVSWAVFGAFFACIVWVF